MNMEDQHVTLLVLLDLSAAFDTVNHRILSDRLQFDFGISGSAPLNLTSLTEPNVSLLTEFYRIFSILNLEFHNAAVSSHYYFLSTLSSFLRSSNHIFLISIVMQMTHNCTSHLDQVMIWMKPLPYQPWNHVLLISVNGCIRIS